MRIEIDGENLYSLIGNFEKEGYVLESKSVYIGTEDITCYGGKENRLLDVELTLRFRVPDKLLKIKE